MDTKKSRTPKPTQQLSITLSADLVEWVTLRAKLRSVTAAELVVEAIQHYRDSGLEVRPRITKAISEGTAKTKTGRYEA